MTFTFKVWQKIKEAWPIYKQHFGTILIMSIVTMLAQFIGGVDDNFGLMLILYVVNLLITYVWVKYLLALIDKKEFNPFSKEALPTLMQFWNLIKTIILYMVFVIAGFVLLIIPGFYVTGRLMFAVYIQIEKNQGARLTMRETWEMTRGYGWKIFWKSLLIGLFMALGFIAFFIGSFITYPLGMIVLMMMYREFKKFKSIKEEIKEAEVVNEKKEDEVPPEATPVMSQ